MMSKYLDFVNEYLMLLIEYHQVIFDRNDRTFA